MSCLSASFGHALALAAMLLAGGQRICCGIEAACVDGRCVHAPVDPDATFYGSLGARNGKAIRARLPARTATRNSEGVAAAAAALVILVAMKQPCQGAVPDMLQMCSSRAPLLVCSAGCQMEIHMRARVLASSPGGTRRKVAGDCSAGGTLIAAGGRLERGEVVVAVDVAVARLAVVGSPPGLGQAGGARLRFR